MRRVTWPGKLGASALPSLSTTEERARYDIKTRSGYPPAACKLVSPGLKRYVEACVNLEQHPSASVSVSRGQKINKTNKKNKTKTNRRREIAFISPQTHSEVASAQTFHWVYNLPFAIVMQALSRGYAKSRDSVKVPDLEDLQMYLWPQLPIKNHQRGTKIPGNNCFRSPIIAA